MKLEQYATPKWPNGDVEDILLLLYEPISFEVVLVGNMELVLVGVEGFGA